MCVQCVCTVCVCTVCVSTCLSDVHPALDDASAEVRPQEALGEHSVHHTGRYAVKLCDGGAHAGSHVLVLLLIPLRPHRAQTVMRNYLLKQELQEEGRMRRRGEEEERGGGGEEEGG